MFFLLKSKKEALKNVLVFLSIFSGHYKITFFPVFFLIPFEQHSGDIFDGFIRVPGDMEFTKRAG
jgi:hypothetical protein